MEPYFFLMRNAPDMMERMSPEQMQAHLDAWRTWMEGLAADGRVQGGHPLGPQGAIVRADTVVDGPFVESKDIVGGYLVITCRSLAHAIETARECPVVAHGSAVEVRRALPNVLG